MDPIRYFTPIVFLEVHFNIIIISKPKFLKRLLSSCFRVWIFHLPYICHTSRPPHLLLCGKINNILWWITYKKIIFILLSFNEVLFTFFHLRFKYLPLDAVREHPESVLFSECSRPKWKLTAVRNDTQNCSLVYVLSVSYLYTAQC